MLFDLLLDDEDDEDDLLPFSFFSSPVNQMCDMTWHIPSSTSGRMCGYVPAENHIK
jgi:hypothetical protein